MRRPHTRESAPVKPWLLANLLDAQGKLEEIRASASAMMSELKLYPSYGALQGAYGQVIATLGLDPLPDSVAAHDVKTLGEAVRASEKSWTQVVNPS